jgi:predicted ATPase
VRAFRSYALVPDGMRQPAQPSPDAALSVNGSTLAATLDQMRDRDPDALQALTAELARWLPEYDAVLFETPKAGYKTVALRTRVGRHRMGVKQLSSGTLLALGLLTIAHDDTGPGVVGIEEPEAGVHPRLLRDVFDALIRMAYPAENGIDRLPRQVIVTTHSPYFLDLFKDIPDSVVIADRHEDAVTFSRLSDHPDADRIVMTAPLGESWFTGVLGGVPAGPTPPTVYPVGTAAA